MANKEAKVVFKTSTERFKQGIDDAKAAIGNLNGELKKNSNELAKNGGDVQLLGQRVDLLSQKHEEQASVVENMRYKLEAAKFAYGENAVEVKKLEGQLKSAEAKLGSYAAQLENAEAKLAHAKTGYGQLTNEIKQQKTQLKQLQTEYANAIIEKGRDSAEAKQLETRINSLNAELRQNKDRLEQAERAARELAGGYQKAESEARDLGNSIGDIAAGNMIADFATEGIQALAGLEEATRQYRNEQNKLEAIAQSSCQSLDDLKGSYSDLYGITADETLSSTAVANMSAMGLSTEQTSTLVHAATGIWAQYGDSIPLDGLMESINETSAVGTVTGNLADALNWASISEDEFNEKLAACSTEQERQQLIIDTLNGAYSGLADSYIENNAAVMAVNESNEKMMDSQSRLAEKIAPLQATITSLAADGIGFLADNLNIIAPIATAAAVAIGILAVAMNFSAITAAATGAVSAMSAALTALSANPVVLVVAGLILIVTTIVTLWNNCEEFRQFWLDLWDGCVASFQKAGEFFSSIGASIRSTVTNISTTVSSVFSNIYNAITSKIAAARDFVGNAISAIKGFFNFSWSLPQIKLPHFSVSGGKAPWGFGGQGSLPKVSVSWYAKAMNTAMVLDSPTIFGYGNGSLLGAGDAGREVVSGESHLIGLIGNAVQKAVSNVSNHNEVNVTVHAQGDPDEIARAVAYKVFDAIDEANTRNGR